MDITLYRLNATTSLIKLAILSFLREFNVFMFMPVFSEVLCAYYVKVRSQCSSLCQTNAPHAQRRFDLSSH